MTLSESCHIESTENLSAFYEGKSVFVTSGTGFQGKVLLEKLLRSCPKLMKIYFLVRHKHGQDILSRFNDLTNSPVSSCWCSLRELTPGYVENMYGPNGLIAAGSKGIARTMAGDGYMNADLVPVDTVINIKHVAVYKCCTGAQYPITWCDFVATVFRYVQRYPTSDILWCPDAGVHHHRKNRAFLMMAYRIPALIIDGVLGFLGKKSIMIKIYNKLEKTTTCFEYFLTRQWNFNDKNVQTLHSALSNEDQKIFDFDVKSIVWETYIESYVLGLRKFVLKGYSDSLAKSRSLLQRLFVLHIFVKLTASYILWMCLSTIITFIRLKMEI